MVNGVVRSARFDAGNNRGFWSITAEYNFPGGVLKEKTLKSRRVHAGEAPGTDTRHCEHIPAQGATPWQDSDPNGEEDGDDRQGDNQAYSNKSSASGVAAGEIEQHGTTWVKGNCELSVGGPVFARAWSFVDSVGYRKGARSEEYLAEGMERGARRSPLYYFNSMMPPQQLNVMLRETNLVLSKKRDALGMSRAELMKFFGVLILITRYEFSRRRTLWNNKPRHKYIQMTD